MTPTVTNTVLEDINLEEDDPFTFPTDRELEKVLASAPGSPCPAPGPYPSECTGCTSVHIQCPN